MKRQALCLFKCQNVATVNDAGEPGSALFTEEHMMFCLNEQEDVL